jgi:hypothetical protein
MSEHLSGSTPTHKGAAIAAATAAAAAVGSSSSDNVETPRRNDGRHSTGSNKGTAEPAGPSGDSNNATNNTNITHVTFTSSEYDDLVEDIVSDKPQLNLTDLEAKLDIISLDDITVSPVGCLFDGGVRSGGRKSRTRALQTCSQVPQWHHPQGEGAHCPCGVG